MNAVFKFDQKEVQEFLICKGSKYDLDEVVKLLDLISVDHIETIVISEEPVYFECIALDLIGAGKGSALCKTCNKTYPAEQLKSIKVDPSKFNVDLCYNIAGKVFWRNLSRDPVAMSIRDDLIQEAVKSTWEKSGLLKESKKYSIALLFHFRAYTKRAHPYQSTLGPAFA